VAKSKKGAVNAGDVSGKLATAIMRLVANIPASKIKKQREPQASSAQRINVSAAKAALAAGGLALPPGPIGWLTILPEMVAVWRIQAQLVSDIAAIHGRKGTLRPEQMFYCLFNHVAPQAVRGLGAGGERSGVASTEALQAVARKVGLRLSQRALGRGIARWFPVVGAGFVGAYVYYDTTQVGKAALEVFGKEG